MATSTSPAYPGTVLRTGSTGSSVARVQSSLRALRAQYPSLPALTVDGKYGSGTASAVRQYQNLKSLAADGAVGENTWNTLVGEYNDTYDGSADTYPGIVLRSGSTGQDVTHLQQALNRVSAAYTAINALAVDGKYGASTASAVRRFQRQFSLSSDGVAGSATWNKLMEVRSEVESGYYPPVTTPYSGTVLRTGSAGDDVRFVQSYLNTIQRSGLTVDGRFGSGTEAAVRRFQTAQNLVADGKVGANTWAALIRVYNAAR